MKTENLDQLTAIIKTFERPKSLIRLLKSIRQQYPALRIILADDSIVDHRQTTKYLEQTSPSNLQYLRLAADLGISASRNAMLARVRTPYFLLLNDDLQFSKRTRLDLLVREVSENRFDLVAGNLIRCHRKFWLVRRQAETGHGTLRVIGNRLTLQPGGVVDQNGLTGCDFVPPFFVARTDRVRAMGGWDSDLKLDEQEEFFFRAKQHELRIAVHSEVAAWHWTIHRSSPEYVQHRSRSFQNLATAKMGLDQVKPKGEQTSVDLPNKQAA